MISQKSGCKETAMHSKPNLAPAFSAIRHMLLLNASAEPSRPLLFMEQFWVTRWEICSPFLIARKRMQGSVARSTIERATDLPTHVEEAINASLDSCLEATNLPCSYKGRTVVSLVHFHHLLLESKFWGHAQLYFKRQHMTCAALPFWDSSFCGIVTAWTAGKLSSCPPLQIAKSTGMSGLSFMLLQRQLSFFAECFKPAQCHACIDFQVELSIGRCYY